MKKLWLIYPNQRWVKQDIGTTWNLNPATLCLLAAMVRDIVDVTIVDAQFYDMSKTEFSELLREAKPDFVGISVLTSEYKETLDIAAGIVREICPSATIIAGGVHVTTTVEFILPNPAIDYCVIGEGEYVLRDLIKHFTRGTPLPVVGLAYEEKGRVIIQQRALVDDLSKLPWPAYDLIDFVAYSHSAPRTFNPQSPPDVPYVRMVTTRGCPCGCCFCQVELISGRQVRTRDPEDVVNELLYLKKTYGVRAIIFDDDNLLMGKNNFAEKLFTLMVENDVGMKWIAIAFALFMLNEEMLKLMKASGCIGVNVAIESGNERVLKEVIGKPIKSLDMAKQIIKMIKDYDIYCLANFIIGFPTETWEEIRETISYAEHCGADYIKIFVAVPLYKTRLYYKAMELGALECNEDYPKVDWRYAQIKSDEWTPRDISILRAFEWDRINFSPHKIERVLKMCDATFDEIKGIRKKTRDAMEL
ncbi:MAG: B12-binding domain-containing radical SAM protein [Trichlorobacter sp.]|uniref:B12-binding domain-containing radical SAM protein n=1 Tax=Trichlorobacter sp. TaxID=2911007 RepID=UPI0025686570|nr:radical SAM protein [Trichlorobacter sp.]MDK9719396.1 B12-binding domain-containing radical SAM protein [Trichlorobacter sp.]